MKIKDDGFVKSLKIRFSVIPAKAGIQLFQAITIILDTGFHRCDDFLRVHQGLKKMNGGVREIMKRHNVQTAKMPMGYAKRHLGKLILAVLVLIIFGCATAPKPIIIKHQNVPLQGSTAVSRTQGQKDSTERSSGSLADFLKKKLAGLLKKKNVVRADEADRFTKEKGAATSSEDVAALVELLKKKNVVSADEADRFTKEKGAATSSEDVAALVELLKKKNVVSADEADLFVKKSENQAVPEKVVTAASKENSKEQSEKTPAAETVEPPKDIPDFVKSQISEEKPKENAESDKISAEEIAPGTAVEMKKDPVPSKIIVVGNSDTKRYHLPGMPYYNKVLKYHRVLFESEQQAIENGYYKAGTKKGAGLPRRPIKEQIKKPITAVEMKKDPPDQVKKDGEKEVPPEAATNDKEQNENTSASSEEIKKDTPEQVKDGEQKDVPQEIATNDKEQNENNATGDSEELKEDSAEPIKNDEQKEIPPASTTRIDDAQVDEIMDGVKEELKSDIHEQVYNQVKEMLGKELTGELKKTDIVPYLPDWMRRLRIFADARLRYQYIFYDKENFNEEYVRSKGNFLDEILNTWADEQSFKYRIRFGLESRNQYFDAAIRLSTGNTTNPISTNATFGDYFNKDTVVVDQAYIKLKPRDFLSIYGGRMPNPWFSTDLVWDSDLNFEGLALAVNKPVTEKITPFMTIGAFPLQQSDVTSLDDTSQHAKWLYAGQIGLKRKDTKGISAQIGLAYYYFSNITGELNETGIAGATDWSMPPYTQYGNTWFQTDPLNDPANFGLASEFKEANVTALLDIGFFDPVHIILTGDYVRNFGFNKSDVAARTGDADPGEWIDGYKIGLSVGHTDIRERGKWRAFFNYKYLGKDAVVDAFTDSDFHIWGTDARGWTIGGEIGLFKNVWLSSRWTAASNISGPQLLMDTFQADLNVEF